MAFDLAKSKENAIDLIEWATIAGMVWMLFRLLMIVDGYKNELEEVVKRLEFEASVYRDLYAEVTRREGESNDG